MHSRFALAVIPLLLAVGAPAQAQEGFRSPSGNISCQYFSAPDFVLRCDISQTSNRPPPRPRDCDLDYGNAFEISASGRGRRLCYGDTVTGQGQGVLGYGQVWRRDGFTCFSAESGVTCRNNAGGGFELSRASQRVF